MSRTFAMPTNQTSCLPLLHKEGNVSIPLYSVSVVVSSRSNSIACCCLLLLHGCIMIAVVPCTSLKGLVCFLRVYYGSTPACDYYYYVIIISCCGSIAS